MILSILPYNFKIAFTSKLIGYIYIYWDDHASLKKNKNKKKTTTPKTYTANKFHHSFILISMNLKNFSTTRKTSCKMKKKRNVTLDNFT